MILDFALDLLEELLEHSLIVLPYDLVARINDRFINPKRLLRVWTELEVPVAATEDEATKLQRLSELRNVIEHNDERATALYCELFPEHGLGPGDRIPVGSREVGYSLAIVEHVAEFLDRRALEKWPDVAIT